MSLPMLDITLDGITGLKWRAANNTEKNIPSLCMRHTIHAGWNRQVLHKPQLLVTSVSPSLMLNDVYTRQWAGSQMGLDLGDDM